MATIINKQIEYLEKLQQEFITKSEKAFKKVFKQIFKDNPEISFIAWNQYTPSFNDGDPCTFTIGETYIAVDKTVKEVLDSEKSFEEYLYEEDESSERYKHIYDSLNSFLYKISGYLADKFGVYGATVYIDKTGKITVEDYDCGY